MYRRFFGGVGTATTPLLQPFQMANCLIAAVGRNQIRATRDLRVLRSSAFLLNSILGGDPSHSGFAV